MSETDKKINITPHQNNVNFVTGVVTAFDREDGIFIAGILSDNPLSETSQEQDSAGHFVGSFAFARQKAKFLRDRLNEFLQEEEEN